MYRRDRMRTSLDEALPGLWRFDATHPEWTEEVGGEEGWDPVVAWWAVATSRGLLLIDPLVLAWNELDWMIGEHGGCAGVVRTIHWHQRSVAQAAERYGAVVWAGPPAEDTQLAPPDHVLRDGEELWDGIQAHSVERADEIAIWLPAQAALLFGDAMLRGATGQLRVCPDSWTQPNGGPARLRVVLGGLAQFPVKHVLVSHGPLVVGDGPESLQVAIG
jgi:Metallo-beta-lactamase superfamily